MLIAGCSTSTVESRKKERAAAYSALTAEEKELVDKGQIQTGMFVRVPLNSKTGMRLLIHSIEFARHQHGEDVCLCIWAGPNFTEALRSLHISGETFEVAAEGTD